MFCFDHSFTLLGMKFHNVEDKNNSSGGKNVRTTSLMRRIYSNLMNRKISTMRGDG